ncbi:MAG: DUF1488 domain-containing protein [Rhizobiales bacterium]|nr:DUF1488 domain-containing protein [Hyphomicrobiales bacterium]
MTINFPNESRSYDPRYHSVRFWGHDEALEVTFLVEEDALTRLDEATPRTEEDFLVAFDRNRERIFTAARKAYSRRGSGFYTLAAANF